MSCGTLEPACPLQFNADNGINDPSSVHKMSSTTNKCTVLVKDLISNVLAFDKNKGNIDHFHLSPVAFYTNLVMNNL